MGLRRNEKRRTGDERRAGTGGALHADTVADVGEDVRVAEAHERQLAPVRVGAEVLERVQERAEQTARRRKGQ